MNIGHLSNHDIPCKDVTMSNHTNTGKLGKEGIRKNDDDFSGSSSNIMNVRWFI
jgi:hypothetical protein